MRRRTPSRGVTTLLFTDIVGSSDVATELGDRRWHRLQALHHAEVRRQLKRHRGREVDTAGDGFFATFTSPASGVRCAFAIVQGVRELGLDVRAGLHTGEAELTGEKVGGIAVTTAARVSAAAGPGKVLATDTIVHLVAGSGFAFTDLGSRELKGVPGRWELFSLDAVDGESIGLPLDRDVSSAARGHATSAAIPSSRRRKSFQTSIALLAVGLAATTVIVVNRHLEASPSTVPADSVGVIEPAREAVTGSIPVQASPGQVTAGLDAVWATNAEAGSVSKIDPQDLSTAATIDVGNGPSGIAVAGDSVWVANSSDGTVSRIDPVANKAVEPIRVGNGPSGVAGDGNEVWVANSLDGTVTRVNASSGKVTSTIAVGSGPTAIAAGPYGVWVTLEAASKLVRINEGANGLSTSAPIHVGNGPDGVTEGDGSVWVTDSLDGTVVRIDPQTGRIASTVTVGSTATAIAATDTEVWVTSEFDETVSRIDPRSNSVTATIHMGNRPEGLAWSNSRLFVAVRASGAGHRGGILTMLDDQPLSIRPIDPAVAGINPSTNDGLIAYKRVGGVEGELLVPDLATSLPEPTNGGKTYTFQLRDGVRYSTGQPLQPDDVLASFERLFKVDGGLGPYAFGNLVGARACTSNPKTCDLSNGIVLEAAAKSATFNLVRPDPSFLYHLTWAAILPAGTPDHVLKKPPIPATGPYMILSAADQEMRLVRNPNFRQWSVAARPDGYPDEIITRYNVTEGAIDQVGKGVADLTPVPSGDVQRASVQYASLLHDSRFPEGEFLFFNTEMPPFDSVLARKAINYALDRTKVSTIAGAPLGASLTCQISPANFPGYEPYCPYTVDPGTEGAWRAPDLHKARHLVAASGTRGTRVTVWWPMPEFSLVVAAYVVSLLNHLGYKASLKTVPALEYSPGASAQIGRWGWGAGLPSQLDFLASMVSCSLPGASNTWSCDRSIDARIDHALRIESSNPGAANGLWANIDKSLVDNAYWVPMYNRTDLSIVSQRVGNFQASPFVHVLVDQLWVV